MGSNNTLSTIPLKALIKEKHNILCVFTHLKQKPYQDKRFSIKNNTDSQISDISFDHNIPVVPRIDQSEKALQYIRELEPDLIVVSCFSTKLEADLLKIPKIGCFNLHPSLLPRHRGPDPLFWQFKDGSKNFGITLHRMEASLDSGNIIKQTKVNLPDGISITQANENLAIAGSHLITQLTQTLANNQELLEIPQEEAKSTYQGFSSKNDYIVSDQWSAQRLFNFVKATHYRGNHYQIKLSEEWFTLKDVSFPQDFIDKKTQFLSINCNPGTLIGILA